MKYSIKNNYSIANKVYTINKKIVYLKNIFENSIANKYQSKCLDIKTQIILPLKVKPIRKIK